jgi:superfamily II DNA/RNA helicase
MPLVINHELPFNAEDFIHRIGRTGRAGSSGDAIALVDNSEKRLLDDIEKLMKRKLPAGVLPTNSFQIQSQNQHALQQFGTSATSRSSSSKKQTPVDPLFYQPYEPSPKLDQANQETTGLPLHNTNTVSNKIVAGGSIKSSVQSATQSPVKSPNKSGLGALLGGKNK